VILHAAITPAISDSMPGILGDPQREEQPRGEVLMLYSISSTQVGRRALRWLAGGQAAGDAPPAHDHAPGAKRKH
jgi:hypothetical protein